MPRGTAEGGGGGTLFLPSSMELTERLRLAESPFKGRVARPDVEGIEKNLTCSLSGIGALALLSPSFEVKDKGAGNTSSRPSCCAEFRYRNEGSSSSSRTGDGELCMSACKSRTMREWAWHSMTNLCILSSMVAVSEEEESVVRAWLG